MNTRPKSDVAAAPADVPDAAAASDVAAAAASDVAASPAEGADDVRGNAGVAEHVVFCPACGGRYVVAAALLRGDVVLLCTTCGKGSKLDEVVERRDNRTLDVADEAVTDALRPRVVVGHEVPAAARSIADTLRRGGFSPVCVRRGDQVLAACDPTMPLPPVAVVLDVGIPDVLAFEIIEGLRASPLTSSLPVVLLASVYERTRYKRRPNRLYGADAYLELHHVPDRLVEVVAGLVRHEGVAPKRVQAPVDRARANGLRTGSPGNDGDAHAPDRDGSRALARRLLSDVALYHGDELAAGIKKGAPFDGIADAVNAARDLHGRAGAHAADFDDELKQFSARLLEREARTSRTPAPAVAGG